MRIPLLGLWPKWSPSDETLLGVFIPAGTYLCMNTSALLRSPKLFGHDADIYNPGRFMSLDPEARLEMEHHVEFAFGSGQWMCAGQNMAFMEINKIIFEVSIEAEQTVQYPSVSSRLLIRTRRLFIVITKLRYRDG